VCQKRVKVKLADGKARTIQHMMMTTFWHPDGTPIVSAQQFMELLFGNREHSRERKPRASDFRSVASPSRKFPRD